MTLAPAASALGVYDLTAEQAYRRLATDELKAMIFDRQANTTVRTFLQVGFKECFAATLEERPYNTAAVHSVMGAPTVANVDQMMKGVDRNIEQNNRRSRDNIEKAYQDEAVGKRY